MLLLSFIRVASKHLLENRQKNYKSDATFLWSRVSERDLLASAQRGQICSNEIQDALMNLSQTTIYYFKW